MFTGGELIRPMTNLNNKTLLTAVTCAWLLTAVVFVAARPSASGAHSQPAASAAAPEAETVPASR